VSCDIQHYALFAALRELERALPDYPRLGDSKRLSQEPVRLGQEPHLNFAGCDIARFEPTGAAGRRRLDQYVFGLLGPNGPMPLNITEFVYERQRQFSDRTIADFLNVLQHRFISLFYRAWAEADPCTQHDRPKQDEFRIWVGALLGLGTQAAMRRDPVPDDAKLGRAGLLANLPRSAAGLETALADYFEVSVEIREFVPAWFDLPLESRLCLGTAPESSTLGAGAVLGASVWLCQQQFEIVIGPLARGRFEQFLPGAKALAELSALVHLYTNDEWAWRLRLRLQPQEPTAISLGQQGKLGWTAWLGRCDGMIEDMWLRGDELPRPVEMPREGSDERY
jgi:type VI secretion system protein ImpH